MRSRTLSLLARRSGPGACCQHPARRARMAWRKRRPQTIGWRAAIASAAGIALAMAAVGVNKNKELSDANRFRSEKMTALARVVRLRPGGGPNRPASEKKRQPSRDSDPIH